MFTSILIAIRKLFARIRYPGRLMTARPDRECPICGYTGPFLPLGNPPRRDGRCPGCGSRERHRLIQLFLQQRDINLNDGRKILHFSPEKYFTQLMQGNEHYHTADIVPGKARHTVDMTDIPFENETFDVVINNHVLEHIEDDRLALKESLRVLVPGGFAILTVPINWSREQTYEDPVIIDPQQRLAQYGDAAHVRYYGRDFPARLESTGFRVECWRLPPGEEMKYGLLRDDVLWIATKPAQAGR